MVETSAWEGIYSRGEQLNRFPYSEVVAFLYRNWRGRVPDGTRALDVGCGSGVHADLMARFGASVTAFDGAASAVERARALFPHELVDYIHAGLDKVDLSGAPIGIVIDRLSSTHSSIGVIESFYARLPNALAPGARIFWQGFDMENSGRALGRFDEAGGTWTDFTGGVFEGLGQAVFLSDDDLARVFAPYRIDRKRMITDTDLGTGYRHSFWTLEMTYPGAT